jgi:hypothetical protein
MGTMSFTDVASRAGWSLHEQCDVMRHFITDQGSDAALAEYADQIARERGLPRRRPHAATLRQKRRATA